MTDFDKAMKTAPDTEKWNFSYDLRFLPGGIDVPCDAFGKVHPDFQDRYDSLCSLRETLHGNIPQ